EVREGEEGVGGREDQRAGIGAHPQAHATREGALEYGQAAAGLEPDQEQLASLVGGEGEARAGAREPVGKMPRRGERELLPGRGGRRRRGGRGHRRGPLSRERIISRRAWPRLITLSAHHEQWGATAM